MPSMTGDRQMPASTYWGTNIVGTPDHSHIPTQPTFPVGSPARIYMREVDIKGTNGSGSPIPLTLASGDGTTVSSGTNPNYGHQYHNPEDTDQLYTSSARINGQLVALAKSQWYRDNPIAPERKYIPMSPPQSPPGFPRGTSFDYDHAFLNPNYLPKDQFRPMGHSHMDFWQICRHHLVWIILFLVVAIVLLQWGNTQKDPFSKAERGLLKEVEK